MPTIRQAMNNAKQKLFDSDTPSLDAQLLLTHIMGVERSYLFAHDDEILTQEHIDSFQTLVNRRADGEPIAYILGTKGFYDLEFTVTPAVLIPRPETELLLEEALRLMKDMPDCTVADIGTGSGALVVTFAKHMPQSRVYATDISESALMIAKRNADRNQVDVNFFKGNLAQPLIDNHIKVDLLMANLPYIHRDEVPELDVSRYEPQLALDGGEDGLDLIRELIGQIPMVCNSGASVLLEIGADQGYDLKTLVEDTLNVTCDILPDYAGLDRIGRFQV